MKVAIIGGTGIYKIGQGQFEPQLVDTPYGQAQVYLGQDEFSDLVFLTRHGPGHDVPPHRVNYRANIQALRQLGVEQVIATFAVGSVHIGIPPRSLVAVDQFLDFTQGRQGTFFEGEGSGLAHVEVTQPFCSDLRRRLLSLAPQHNLEIRPTGTYVCTNGPRFETAAEIRMFAQLGGDVVGMTAAPEAPLARELGLCYAGLALSINWAAGVTEKMTIEREGMAQIRAAMLALCVTTLRTPATGGCECKTSLLVVHPPTAPAERKERRC
jgi:5'-methylthioadenosine phosphorylase